MNLFPFHKFIINTDLDIIWIKKRISNNIRVPHIFLSPFDKRRFEKDFVGTFENNSFKVSRVLEYGNPVMTIIKGRIIEKEHGADIILTVRLPIVIYALFLIWLLAPIIAITIKIPHIFILDLFKIRHLQFILTSLLSYLIIAMLGYLGIIINPLNYREKETIKILEKLLQ